MAEHYSREDSHDMLLSRRKMLLLAGNARQDARRCLPLGAGRSRLPDTRIHDAGSGPEGAAPEEDITAPAPQADPQDGGYDPSNCRRRNRQEDFVIEAVNRKSSRKNTAARKFPLTSRWSPAQSSSIRPIAISIMCSSRVAPCATAWASASKVSNGRACNRRNEAALAALGAAA